MVLFSAKEMIYRSRKRNGGTFTAHYQAKEANLKRLHHERLQPHDILEKPKLWRQSKEQWLPGVEGDGGMNRQSKEDF